MNTLSIVLYLSDVLYSLVDALIFFSMLGWIIYFFSTGVGKLWASEDYSWDQQDIKDRKKRIRETPWIPSAKWLWLTGAIALFVTLVPSKDVFYLIAASEAGEAVVNTPEAKEIMNDVKEIIDIQLEKLKK